MVPRRSPIRERRLYHFAGLGVSGKYGVHSNSLRNVRRALVERVFNVEVNGKLQPPPQPEPGVFDQGMREFRERLRSVLPTLQPLSVDQFVDSYSGRRREVYRRAGEEFVRSGVKPKHSMIKAFVKAEKIFLDKKPDPAPRIIQPRGPVYNVALGRFLKHAEKPLFKAIGRVFGATTVYKGLNAHASAAKLREQWERFRRPVAIGLDASRFDQHVSRDALKYEHSIWPMFYRDSGDRAELCRLLACQLTNKGVAYADDGKIPYRTNGCRMSGDMNTSSGNCLLMCAMIYTYMSSLGINDYHLANNGDDCVVIMESSKLPKLGGLVDWFHRRGFTMKVEEPVYEFEQIDFCQTQPCYTGKGWVMVRNPHSAMPKDLHSNCDIRDEYKRSQWLDAMNQGGLALTDGVPCWASFYSMFECKPLRRGDDMSALYESGFWRLSQGMTHDHTTITPEARYSFWLAFGILPDQQVLFEERVSRIRLCKLPVELHAPHYVGQCNW